MTRHVNKRMILTINRMCWRLAGGLDPCGSDNLLEGRTLGFVEGIHQNEMFGQTLYSHPLSSSGRIHVLNHQGTLVS